MTWPIKTMSPALDAGLDRTPEAASTKKNKLCSVSPGNNGNSRKPSTTRSYLRRVGAASWLFDPLGHPKRMTSVLPVRPPVITGRTAKGVP